MCDDRFPVPSSGASSVGSRSAPVPLRCARRWQSGRPPERPLSAESAESVREAALAVVRSRVRYLTVVDDGSLVGIVPVPWTTRRHD